MASSSSRSGSRMVLVPPGTIAPRSRRWPVVRWLSRMRRSRMRSGVRVAIGNPTSLASAPMSPAWLYRRSSSRSSARRCWPAGGTRVFGRVFERQAVGEVVADGRVAGDAFGELDASVGVAAFEELFDAFVDEPEAGLHGDDRFANDGEAKVAGFDDAGMDWSDWDLVDTATSDATNGNGSRRRPLLAAAGASRRMGCQSSGQCWWWTSRRGSGWSTSGCRTGRRARVRSARRKAEFARLGSRVVRSRRTCSSAR